MRFIPYAGLVLAIVATSAHAQPKPAQPACPDGPACTALAVDALKRNDAAASTRYLQRACDLGSADGCAGLGKAYQTGRGVAIDLGRAERAYRAACTGGVMNACHNLALAIERKDMSGTPAEVVQLLTRSCDQGVKASCDELARVKASATAAPPPAPPPATCSKANPAACLAACMKQADLKVCNDAQRWGSFTEAEWDKLAQRRCALKDWYACVEVGWRHERARSPAAAFKHYKLACDGGHVGCAAATRLKACKAKPRTCPKPSLPAELVDDGEADVWAP